MMKRIVPSLLAGAALVLAGCSQAPQNRSLKDFYTQRIEGASSFQDSLIATDGSFIGGFFNLQSADLPFAADKNEMLRGMRDVLATDTANLSYITGLKMGLSVFDVYKQLSAGESFSKEAFIATIAEAFRLDSVSPEEVQELQPLFQQMFTLAELQAKKRAEKEIYNTKAAIENRMMGDAIAEKYQANPDFKAVGSDGLMVRVITEGNGEVINPNSPIVVTLTESHADSGHDYRTLTQTPLLAGNPRNEVLQSVIPYMSVGETAEFFVPYQLAYGVSGDKAVGVGPCESVKCVVKIEPYVFQVED